jgi:hypothetical protein
MAKKSTKAVKKQPKKEEKNSNLTSISVVAIWKNWSDKLKKNYWTFVLEDNSRLACFDPKVLEELKIDLKEKVVRFDFPQKLEVKVNGNYIVSTKEGQPVQESAKSSKSFTPRFFNKSNSANIDRMSVLRTAVMFLEHQKDKSLKSLQEITAIFEKYVQEGKWE